MQLSVNHHLNPVHAARDIAHSLHLPHNGLAAQGSPPSTNANFSVLACLSSSRPHSLSPNAQAAGQHHGRPDDSRESTRRRSWWALSVVHITTKHSTADYKWSRSLQPCSVKKAMIVAPAPRGPRSAARLPRRRSRDDSYEGPGMLLSFSNVRFDSCPYPMYLHRRPRSCQCQPRDPTQT